MRTQRLVLVLGGDTQTQDLLRTALTYFTFCTATDAAHAWKLATTECPDIIVTDPAASALEGTELVRQLKDHPTTAFIPVLGITAQPYSEQQEDASAARCDALLMMPVTGTTLRDVARLLITRAGFLRQRSTRLTDEATARRVRSTNAQRGRAAEYAVRDPVPAVPADDAHDAPRCHRCGSDADNRLVRTTPCSATYRCGVCHRQWRSTFKMPRSGRHVSMPHRPFER